MPPLSFSKAFALAAAAMLPVAIAVAETKNGETRSENSPAKTTPTSTTAPPRVAGDASAATPVATPAADAAVNAAAATPGTGIASADSTSAARNAGGARTPLASATSAAASSEKSSRARARSDGKSPSKENGAANASANTPAHPPSAATPQTAAVTGAADAASSAPAARNTGEMSTPLAPAAPPVSHYPGKDEPPKWEAKPLTPPDMKELVGPFLLTDESLNQVLALYEKMSGKFLLRTQTIPGGKINFNVPHKIPRAEAVAAIESLLVLNGVSIVPIEGTPFYKASSADSASLEGPPLYTDAASVAKLAPSERSATRLFLLRHTPAKSASETLSTLVNKARGDTLTLVPAANAFLFTTSINNLQRAEKIIANFDQPDAVTFFALKHLRPSELKRQLQALQSGANPLQNILGGEITMEADDLSGRLLVITPPANREKIQNLITQLDKSDVTLRILHVRHMRASEIKKLLTGLSASAPVSGDGGGGGGEGEGGRGGGGKPASAPSGKSANRNALRNTLLGDFTLEADDTANQLLILTTPENHPRIEELVTHLDKSNMVLKFYEIKNLRPTDIKKLIQSLQSGGGGGAGSGEGEGESRSRRGGGGGGSSAANAFRNTLVGDFLLEADNLANRVMVVTNPQNHEKVQEIIREMDRNNMVLEFHEIKHLRATEIKGLIETLRNNQPPPGSGGGRGGREEEGNSAARANPDHMRNLLGGEFILAADDLANRLMVLTKSENQEKIREIISRMDQNKTLLKFYDIKNLRSSEIKRLVETLKSGGGGASGGGSSRRFRYDSSEDSPKDAFRNLLGGDFIIETNDLANRLMVIAQPQVQEKIAEIIREMDQNTSELILYKTKSLKPSRLKKLLETLRTGKSQNQGSDDDDYYSYSYRRRDSANAATASLLGGDITIEADDQAGQLIVVAQPQVREKIHTLLSQLDAGNAPATSSEIMGLKHAEIENTVRTLATIVTGKSSNVQTDGSNTNAASRNNTGARGTLNGVSTTTNTYRTYSFTNRPGANLSTNNSDYWDFFSSRANREAASQSREMPNVFSEHVTVTGDERTNRLMLFGTPEDITRLKALVAQLDAPLPQVSIEAIIVEVTLANGEASGLDTLGLGYRATSGVNNVSSPDYNFRTSTPALPGTGTPPFSVTGSLRDFSLSILFSQAERNSRVRILSAPLINASHHQPATFFVGEEHPVVTSTLSDLANTTSTRSTIEFKQIGLSLSVTPRVGANGTVEMKVDQTTQSISRTVTVDGNEQPVTASRSASSYLKAGDNETIVLAGLQSYREIETSGVVWLLGHIPLLGSLFRPETSDTTRTEIIIFLKPHIHDAGAPDSPSNRSPNGTSATDFLPGLRPGALTQPDAKTYLETGRFDALSLTPDEHEVIKEIRERQHAAAHSTKENQQAQPREAGKVEK